MKKHYFLFILFTLNTVHLFGQLNEFNIQESKVPKNWKEELIARGVSLNTKFGNICKNKVFNIKETSYSRSKESFTEDTRNLIIENNDSTINKSTLPISYLENNNIYLLYDTIKLSDRFLVVIRAHEIIFWSDKFIVTQEISPFSIDLNTGRKLSKEEIDEREKERLSKMDGI